MFSLLPGFNNHFRLYLTNYITTSHFKSLPLKSRHCLLPHDLGSSLVHRSRCTLVCAMEFIYQVCGCHPYYMPILLEKSKSIRNCTILDLYCIRNRTGKHLRVGFSFDFLRFHLRFNKTFGMHHAGIANRLVTK